MKRFQKFKLRSAFFILLFLSNNFKVFSQSPPDIQWTWSVQSNLHLPDNTEDWIYSITQTSDGGYIGAGYVEIYDPLIFDFKIVPSIVKVDVCGEREWELTLGTIGGYCDDVIEVSDGSYMIRAVDGPRCLIAKVDLSGTILSTNYYGISELGTAATDINATDIGGNYSSVREVINSGIPDGFIIGTTYSTTISGIDTKGAMLIRLNNDLTVRTSFGTNGYVMFADGTPGMIRGRNARVIYNAGVAVGFIFVGMQSIDNSLGYFTDTKAWIVKTDINGTILWQRIIDRSALSIIGDPGTAEVNSCPSFPAPPWPLDEKGFSVEQLNDSEIAVNIWVDYYEAYVATNCFYENLDYPNISAKVVLLKLDLNTGNFNLQKYITSFEGVDFFTPMIPINNGVDGFYFAGNIPYANAFGSGYKGLNNKIVKTDSNGDITPLGWEKEFLGDEIGAPTGQSTGFNNCLFAMAKTADGGLVVAGNNEIEDENQYIVKLTFDPVQTLLVNSATICAGETATLTASGVVSYVWSTGATIDQINVTPVVNTTYTVTGTLSDGCTATAIATVTVNPIPVATISPSGPITSCAVTLLNANTGSGFTYQWQLNSVNISGATLSTYSATVSGNYTVIVFQGFCSVTSSVASVTINPNPVPNVPSDFNICAGSLVAPSNFTSTPSGATFTWTNSNTAIGLGASGTFNTPSFTATNISSLPIIATITVTATLSGCTGSSTYTITVNPTPIVSISPSGPITSCNPVTLGAITGSGMAYQWQLNSVNISGAISSTYTASSSGNYSVTVTDVNGCFATSAPVTISIPVVYDYPSGLTIFSNTTWNNVNYKINGQLTIFSGATLTIQGNSIIEFSSDPTIFSNVVVAQNGKLIVDNSTLRGIASCNKMWNGIEVWGTSTISQTYPLATGYHPQGFIWFRNNAIVQDMRKGILIGDVDPSGNPILSSSGGVIWADNSQFKNNRISVKMNSYGFSNRTRFFKSNFTSDPAFIDPVAYLLSGNDAFLDLTQVFIIPIRGCSFINNGSYALSKRGYGIRSIDARYIVDNTCEILSYPCNDCAGTRNTFTNLYYGIYSVASDPLNSVTIKNANFSKNVRGILLRGIDYAKVNANTFDVGDGARREYGLYLDMCSGYQTEENQYSSSYSNNKGTIINVSGSYGNEIYNNKYQSINIGTQVQGSNTGLQIKYNNYVSGLYTANIALTPASIMNPQGLCSPSPQTAAGNTFSHTCPNPEGDYYSNAGSTPFSYRHHNDLLRTPTCKDAAVVFPSPCGLYASPISHLCNPLSGSALKTAINQYASEVQTKQALIDNGNALSLYQAIASNMSPGDLKNLLLSRSPYLADGVLIASINRVDLLPYGILKNILIANSPLSEPVIIGLDNRIPSIPSGIRSEIDNAQTGVSARDELILEIAFVENQRQSTVNELIRFFLNDTILTNGKDSVIVVLKNEIVDEAKCQLVSAYVSANKFTEATALIAETHPSGVLDNFCYVQKVLIELKQASESCYLLKTDSLLKQIITVISKDTNHRGCPNAQALLSMVFSEKYEEQINELDPPGHNPFLFEENKEINSNKNKSLYCYPNPTSGTLIINYSFKDLNKDSKIILYNMVGEIVQKMQIENNDGEIVLNVSDFRNGIYSCVLMNNGNIIARDKITVIK